ncbi:MAG: hypothetical protein JNJ46_07910 [Myxococcales bacterium]|nr:hypothetical protein [Myxococcales bacterium]
MLCGKRDEALALKNPLAGRTTMNKLLLGLTAVFALSVAAPAFAAEEKKDDKAEKAEKPAKKGKKKAEKEEK